jgi:GT2 family glycosyltransferase
VSVIIPSKNHARLLARCLGSIETKTTYGKYEILVADNGSTDPATKELLARLRHKVVPFPEPFNYSRINNFAVRQANGEYLLFLNDDTEVRSPEWMTAMLELCQLPGVGAVGAKLLFPSGRVQHAGVVLGLGGVAGHAYYQFSAKARGYFDALHSIRNFSAVTAACMMVRRSVFEQVGGFDEAFPLNFNDVDFCLRVRRAGYRIVWTPFAELYHYESATRVPQVKVEEMHLIHERWGALLLNDPFYSPNLTLQKGDYSLRM